jgi:hypothetical protein
VDGSGAVDGEKTRLVATVIVDPPDVLLPAAAHDPAHFVNWEVLDRSDGRKPTVPLLGVRSGAQAQHSHEEQPYEAFPSTDSLDIAPEYAGDVHSNK